MANPATFSAFRIAALTLVMPVLLGGTLRVDAQSAAKEQTAGELLAAGEAAYNAGEWAAAARHFLDFLANYEGVSGTETAIAKVKPLLALCQVRLGEFEAALPLLNEALETPGLDTKQRADLQFFSGLAALRTGKTEIARQRLGEVFNDATADRGLRMEALVLAGMSYVIEENWKEAASFFTRYTTEIRSHSPEAGARAEILLLHALMQEEQWEEAYRAALEIHRHLDRTRQIVTFSSQLIELGNHFLSSGSFPQAILLLRKVPAKHEIERLQKDRIAEAETELRHLGSPSNATRASQIQTSIDEMRRELAAFETIPQFDSAARLRLASAYFELGRIREACLIIDQMVRQMDADPIVESATASLMRGWMSLERHARAVRTADLYLERCASLEEKPNLPEVLFLRAQALEGQFLHREAADGFLEVARSFADLPIAAQASFMAAYNLLQLEAYDEGGAMLELQAKQLEPQDPMWAHVTFWRAMAYYFGQQWEACRKQLSHYLDAVRSKRADAEYVDDAHFRIGYSLFSEARYPEAIKALRTFVDDHPQSEWLPEALLTLGDSLGAEGELDDADAAYARISPEAPGFHDEGWMKRGNILRARKDLPAARKLYTDFLERRSDSPRIAEALQWLGWISRQEGDHPQAREIYWNAIHRFGDEPARPGVEDIFLALQSLYPGPDLAQLESLLTRQLSEARDARKNRLAVRLGWTLAHLKLSGKNAPDGQTLQDRQADYRSALVSLVPSIEAKDTAPRILADVGDALAENEKTEDARTLYESLRKWWPRAPERDRAYAGLGFIALGENDNPAALAAFDRYEKSSVMPKTSPDERGISLIEGELGGKVALARAAIIADTDPEAAIPVLLALQKSKTTPARLRAEAFLETARLHVRLNRHREALPYFEQIYLLFNRFPNFVASAYFERGQALEALALPEKAREVYSELAHREDLSGEEPARLGIERAHALGGIIPRANPENALIPPVGNR